MKDSIKFQFARIGIMIVMIALLGAAVMLLWNALMPQIFGFPGLNFLQAAGMVILARILFGGLGSLGGPGRFGPYGGRVGDDRLFHHGNALREKWLSMSDDERSEFLRSRRNFSNSPDFSDEQSSGRKNNSSGSEGGKL